MLIVAPDSDLNTLTEVIAAAGVAQPTILSGTVTGREVLSTIDNGDFVRIHFGGHASRHSLLMSDGALSTDLLEQVLERAETVELVILNACNTIDAAASIYASGVFYVIGWSGPVADDAAQMWAVAFWNSYKFSRNVRSAFEHASDAIQRNLQHEAPILLNGRDQGYQSQIMTMLGRQKPESANVYRWAIIALLVIDILIGLTFHF